MTKSIDWKALADDAEERASAADDAAANSETNTMHAHYGGKAVAFREMALAINDAGMRLEFRAARRKRSIQERDSE